MRNAILTLTLSQGNCGVRCRLALEKDSKSLTAEFSFLSPVQPTDVDDVRWLIEDHPRLHGHAADGIAARIEGRLEELGAELRSSVFESSSEAAPIRAALEDANLVSALRVRINEPAGTQWTPWELLFAPGQEEPLSLRVASFVRLAPTTTSEPSAADDRDLRVLLVVARPRDEDDVPFRSVASRIIHAVASHDAPLRVDLLRPPTFASLGETLARAEAEGAPYQVVHFDGHGVYRGSVFAPGRKRGYLRFEGEAGGADEVDGQRVGELLAERGVRLLLLNACRSAYAEPTQQGATRASDERSFGSLATEVLTCGVPSVLAMGFNVYVVTAARLIGDIYAALAAGRRLGEALAHARRCQARRDRALIASRFDWLVPIAYDPDAVPLAAHRGEVPELYIPVSTTTPATHSLADPDAGDGPRSDKRPFVGYDGTLLRLEHALNAHPVAELVGLAGAGKSAVAAEFARWTVATKAEGQMAFVVDLAACPSFQAFSEAVAERLAELAMPEATAAAWADAPALGVLEDVDAVLAENATGRWSEADRQRLDELLQSLGGGRGRSLLTGRAPSGLRGVETVVLEGLDAEGRKELAAVVGWDVAATPGAAALMEWSGGLPAIVAQLPKLAMDARLESIDDAHELLSQLRMGAGDYNELAAPLIERCRLRVYDARELTDPTLRIVLHLFQGFLSAAEWGILCEFAERKGWPLGGSGDPSDLLHHELRPALHAGLACRLNQSWYLLHPLAPGCLRPGFDGTVAVLAGQDPERHRNLLILLWSMYCQALSAALRVARYVPEVSGGLASLARERQNLWHAVDLAISGGWGGLALPLIRVLRDELLAEQRVDEWEVLLRRVLEMVQQFSPEDQDMGPESAPLHLARLFAEEAERGGDDEAAAELRELAVRLAFSEDVTLDIDQQEGESGRGLDIGRNRKWSALVKRGDAAVRDDSSDCLSYYLAAYELAEEGDDLLRLGEVQLAVARAFLNVSALRDFAKYEEFARLALKTGEQLGPLGKDLLARAKLSLGNAIVEQIQATGKPDPERVNEARACLLLAATADASGADTRSSARNGLGILHMVAGDPAKAADEYLAASDEFDSQGDWNSLAMAQTNAANALARAGKLADARGVALEALANLEWAPSAASRVAPVLRAILAAADEAEPS